MNRRMSPLDAGFIHMESHEAPQHGSVLITFRLPADAPPDYMHRMFTRMREFPVTAEPFNYCLAPGWSRHVAPSWKLLPPERIDLDYHLRHSALPQPGSELELALLVSRLVTRPVDLTRPPWEMHLIEGLAGNRYALYMKMHHAVLDGMTVSRMLQAWLSKDPKQTGIRPLWAHHAPVRPAALRRKPGAQLPASPWQHLLESAKGPLAVLEEVRKAFNASFQAARGQGHGLVAPYTAPRSLFNGPISQRRRVSTQRLEFSRFKAIADHIAGTVNDAVALVVGTALRRYLVELDALPQRPLVASVLASLRGKQDESGGNLISFIFADLATDTADISERAARVRASTSAGKQHLLGMHDGAPLAYSGLMMAPFVLASVLRRGHQIPPLCNIALSNVPGPRVPLYLNGAEAEGLHATTIIYHGMALVIAVMSWNQHLSFTFTACPDAAPHSQRLAVYLADALEETEKSLAQSRPTEPREMEQ